MSDAPRPPRARKARRLRILAVALSSLVVLLIVAAIAGRIAIDRALQQKIPAMLSRKPQLLTVEWESARSGMPGVVHVRGLVIKKQTRRAQWIARLDRADARVSLSGLMHHELSFGSIDGDGLTLQLRFRAPPRPDDPEDVAAWEEARADEPAFTEWTNPPDPAPEKIRPPDPKRRHWRWRFEDVDVTNVREVWIGSHRFQGIAELRAKLVDVRVHDFLEIDRASLVGVKGAVTIGGAPLVSGVEGRLSCTIPRHDLGDGRAVALLDDLGGDADVKGNAADLRVLGTQFRAIRGLAITSGSGPVHAIVKLRKGRFAKGTSIDTQPRALDVRVFDTIMRGDADMSWIVTSDEKGDVAHGSATFPKWELAYVDAPRAHVVGKDLKAGVATHDLDLRHPFEDAEVTVNVPDARITSLAAYSRWFPKAAPFVLTGGTATLKGDLVLGPDTGHGHVAVASRDVRVRAEDVEYAGSLDLDAPLVSVSTKDGRFDFSGTRVGVKDVSSTGARGVEGWWGRVTLPKLVIDSGGKGFRIAGSARAELRDSEPIVSAWATRKLVAKLFRGALTDRNVTASAEFDAGTGGWRVDDVEVHGDTILALACLDVQPPRKRGAVYFDGGFLSVGIRLEGEGRDVTPFARRKWWDRNRDACASR